MKMWNAQRGTGRWLWLALALLAMPAVHAQAKAVPLPDEPAARITASAPRSAAAFAQIVREVDDPHTGVRWLLVRDASHPGGPGRMLPVAELESKDRLHLPGGGLDSRSGDATSFHPIVRAGDQLTIEEHTRVADAYLEAIALGPASVGSVLNVRLKVGGRVVRALALGPGRAAFEPETKVQP